ncbi:hypothetical protein [Klebsiella sp. BIGb0407]|uniref:hypothetical protein n=1 Tax=Klebsiella sp. BIGb0407 TaxID=2940603 RepID=UPI0021691D93|nr:hypothetical protein [Klebsiella sp. BIGb0407]MCS3434584.1 hypothetical protein [Klebsiella sp. BIGb0407]
MISDTVKYSSTPTISDSKKVDDDHPQNNSESSALTSDISFVRNSTNMRSIKKNTTPIADGFLNRVWRCFQTSDGNHSNGNICDEEGTELTEILTQGENLRQQAHSLCRSDSEAPVPHGWRGSLLKRCLVGAGLLTGTGVLGGMGYAGYKYYNHGTSSTEKSRYTIQETGETLEESFGNHTLYHDGAANMPRHYRRHLFAPAYNTTASNLNDGGWINNSQNDLESINHRIINLLYREGLLPNKKSKYKEKMLYAVSQYLDAGNNTDIQTENNIKSLAQKILYGSGIYGEKKNEELSNQQGKSVVRCWVLQNILGTTPEKYIESKIKLDISRIYTVDDIHHLLPINTLPVVGSFHPERLHESEKTLLSTMWRDCLIEEMPFLLINDEGIGTMSLNDFDFASLYAGSHFIRGIKGDVPTLKEAISVGESMWDSAIGEGVSEDEINYYRVPAILFYATQSPGVKDNKNMHDITLLYHYLSYRKEIYAIQKDFHLKYDKYTSAAEFWLPKGKLADEIIAHCPTVKGHINEWAAAALTHEKREQKVWESAKQYYLNDWDKPCDFAPDNLNDEYTQSTHAVANSFHDIDKYFIYYAMNTLPKDEKEFIFSPNVTIKFVELIIDLNKRYGSHTRVLLSRKTDVFSVHSGRSERIYALQEINEGQRFYRLIRVDRDLKKYIENKIFDEDYLEWVLGRRNFAESNFDDSYYIHKETFTDLDLHDSKWFIDELADRHRKALFKSLYEQGNELSELENTWSVFKHFIPFYDCIEQNIEGNHSESIPACILDVLSLIPVLGTASSLSGKFSLGLIRGLRSGAASLGREGIKGAGKNLLREVTLPTVTELNSLGKSALMVFDPGFSLLMSASRISRTFAKKIIKLISRKKEMAALVRNLKTRIAKLPLITPSKPLTGVLAGTELEVPILAVGKKNGENIYVKMNPKTGEKFGTKYICRGEGVLLPASSILGRHKRSVSDIDISRLVNDTSANYNRVKRMDNNRLRCPTPLAISPGSQYYINSYERVRDIENIPRLNGFLTRSATHPYRAGFVDFNEDTTYIAETMKAKIRTYYQSENFLAFRLEQGSAIIPAHYYRQNDYFHIYKHGVDRAKKLVETLDDHFRDIKIQRLKRISAGNMNLRRLENYLSVKLRLDTIDDIRIEKIIREESITRLQDYIRDMKFYFNNEINSIYFVTANIHPYAIRENLDLERVAGFVFPTDKYRRVIIMPDFYSVNDLDRYLVDTILHEVSHIAGSLDYHVSSGVDIQDSMARFNGVALGIEPGYIVFDDHSMEYYQHTTRREISKEQLTELIRRDPVLRANLFMDNAYFLPTIIEELCAILQ